MSEHGQRRGMTCREARERVHRVLDGDLMLAEARQELDLHLVSCRDCRQADAELGSIQQSLRALPSVAFPDDELERLWARTTRRGPRKRRRALEWRAAAAAAVLAVGIYGAVSLGPPASEPQPSPEEIALATEQARMVLGLTARALRDARQTAFNEVLANEVSPALQRISIPWPDGRAIERRNSTNGA